jgi:hypothetical protein
VQSIYAAQLDDLPPDARRLARRASVAGRRFPVRALAPLGAEAETGLQSLQSRQLVVGPLTEPLWGEAFAYRHALLRDAGYASLARAERARLHVRLARWLEQAAADRSTEIAEQIAGHYSAALESAPSLTREIDDGVDRDEVGRLAAEWYERAGQGTLALSAHDAARQLFKRSIDLTSDERRLEKARRWERLGDATAFAADMDEGAAAYQKAMELYREAIEKGSAGFDRGSEQMTKASERLAKGADLLGRISPDGAAGLLEGAQKLRRGADEIQQQKQDFQAGMASAQAGLARTTAELANVMYQQLQFAEAKQLAARVRAELGPIDKQSEARLLTAEALSALGAHGPSPETGQMMQQALDLAHESGDALTELRAREALLVFHAESGRYEPSEFEALVGAARAAGDHGVEVSASLNAAGMLGDDHAAETFDLLAHARELALAYGLTDDVGWTYMFEAEAAFVTGDWDRAVAAGKRSMDIGESNAYLRLTVRNIHVMVPIAAVRGDMAMLDRAASFYRSLEGKFEFPDSPYSRVIRVAQDLELAAAGLWPPYLPDVEPRLVSFQDEPTGGAWSAALDRVLRAWLESGELEGAGRALDAMEQALPRYSNVSQNGLGTYKLMRGRLALALGHRELTIEFASSALEHFRACKAPWWIAKSIRLLQSSGAADEQLVDEVEEIERRLGAIGPTL